MKKILSLILVPVFCVACSSSDSNSNNNAAGDCENPASSLDTTSSTASYCITFTAQWVAADFGTVPGNAHFTTLVGSAVTEESSLWNSGNLASSGMEDVAETGNTSAFIREIETEIAANRALKAFTASGTGATGSSEFQVDMSRVYPRFTFATMVAPSPDWFVGLSEYHLMNGSGEWIADTGDINLAVYDAGTETGNTFSLNGTPTVPAQNIARLTETVGTTAFVNGVVGGKYIAKVRFVRVQ